jgi:aldehyde:ferredoxin oxidoreductase
MGFMNLKAIAVRGDKRVPVSDEKKLRTITEEVNLRYKSQDVLRYHEGGTPAGYASMMKIGNSPTYNFAGEEFGDFNETRAAKLAWPGGYELVLSKTKTCYMCTIACRRVSRAGEGKYTIENNVEGTEYETLSMLGSNCGIDDIYAVSRMNDLCNRYGLDTISTGATISFAMECFERGILTKEETDGLELRFGEADCAIEMIHRIAGRQGFGNVLAEGSRRAARLIGKGSERYAIQVKGLELAAHDPRAFPSGGPHYACQPIGAHHRGIALAFEVFNMSLPQIGLPGPYERFSEEGKGELAKKVEDWTAFVDTLGFCLAATNRYGPPERFLAIYTAVTGQSINFEEAFRIGERTANLKKAFNFKHGIPRDEDTLPERLLEQPNRRANNAVVKLGITMPQYYKARGWDDRTGAPTQEKLHELGLDDIAGDIYLH